MCAHIATNSPLPSEGPRKWACNCISGLEVTIIVPMAAITPFIAPQATWDLRVARVDRSAAWRARQNAKPRRATARGPFLCSPFLVRVGIGFLSCHLRPPSLSVEYRGPNAWHVEFRCSIVTTTRHILALRTDVCPVYLSQVRGVNREQGRAST